MFGSSRVKVRVLCPTGLAACCRPPSYNLAMPPKAELRDYLAVERTFLAWIRTGLALMGFGFVVARFGLFLQQIQLVNHAASAPTGLSLWFGTALIAAGILVYLGSAWRYVQLVRQLDRCDTGSSRSLSYAVATALFLAAVGLAMAIYLLSVRKSAAATTSSVQEEITMPAEPASLQGGATIRLTRR